MTVTALLLGYPVAYLLSVSRRKHLLLFLIVLPLMMDVLVRAYGWIVLLSRSGLVNRVFVATGMFARPMQFLGTETAVVLELLHEVLPFMILPIAGVLQRIDPALREAAVGLGAAPFTAFLAGHPAAQPAGSPRRDAPDVQPRHERVRRARWSSAAGACP